MALVVEGSEWADRALERRWPIVDKLLKMTIQLVDCRSWSGIFSR
jgi:hypothetical protein